MWITLDIDMLIESITKCYYSGHNGKVTIAMLMVIMGGFLQKLFTTSTFSKKTTNPRRSNYVNVGTRLCLKIDFSRTSHI